LFLKLVIGKKKNEWYGGDDVVFGKSDTMFLLNLLNEFAMYK